VQLEQQRANVDTARDSDQALHSELAQLRAALADAEATQQVAFLFFLKKLH
jgi:multidrug resistance efflux pump